MKAFFIAGTGTGVGKTLFTCALAYRLRERKAQVQALKPVISGFDAERVAESDTGQLIAAQGLPMSQAAVDDISPWRFAAPLSPDMAGEDERKSIDFDALVAFCRKKETVDHYLLIEGVGGIMTPLDARHTVLDWAVALKYPVILLSGSYLGSLSHTLSAARVITEVGLPLHAVVVSESENQPAHPARTLAILQRFLPQKTRIHLISRLDSGPDLWKYVPESIIGIL